MRGNKQPFLIILGITKDFTKKNIVQSGSITYPLIFFNNKINMIRREERSTTEEDKGSS